MAKIAGKTKRYPSDLTDQEWERNRAADAEARMQGSGRGRSNFVK
jgi:hypothetical protein